MPRYFFDLEDHETYCDETGYVCADVDEARIQAVIFTGEYLKNHPELVWDGREIRIKVRDEQGRIALTVIALSVEGS